MLVLRVFALFIALAVTAQAQPTKLIGTWVLAPGQDIAVEMASFGPEITFGADGTLSMRFATPPPGEETPSPGTFRANADTIHAVIDGREQPARYWFEKDTLAIEDRSEVLRWRRKSGG